GGHSGIDIHKGLANANLLLARVLASLFGSSPFYLQHWTGGVLRNVITREASAAVLGDFDRISQLLPTILQTLQAEYKITEPNLTVTVEKLVATDALSSDAANLSALSIADSQRVLNLLRSLPNGVIRMSDSFAGVVD
ncbi:cytosol nonspecific dipeptidase, partial [Rahnella sp. C60]|nr:cytosol nonspecific dipeptidase [Rahnella perminowiae]